MSETPISPMPEVQEPIFADILRAIENNHLKPDDNQVKRLGQMWNALNPSLGREQISNLVSPLLGQEQSGHHTTASRNSINFQHGKIGYRARSELGPNRGEWKENPDMVEITSIFINSDTVRAEIYCKRHGWPAEISDLEVHTKDPETAATCSSSVSVSTANDGTRKARVYWKKLEKHRIEAGLE